MCSIANNSVFLLFGKQEQSHYWASLWHSFQKSCRQTQAEASVSWPASGSSQNLSSTCSWSSPGHISRGNTCPCLWLTLARAAFHQQVAGWWEGNGGAPGFGLLLPLLWQLGKPLRQDQLGSAVFSCSLARKIGKNRGARDYSSQWRKSESDECKELELLCLSSYCWNLFLCYKSVSNLAEAFFAGRWGKDPREGVGGHWAMALCLWKNVLWWALWHLLLSLILSHNCWGRFTSEVTMRSTKMVESFPTRKSLERT